MGYTVSCCYAAKRKSCLFFFDTFHGYFPIMETFRKKPPLFQSGDLHRVSLIKNKHLQRMPLLLAKKLVFFKGFMPFGCLLLHVRWKRAVFFSSNDHRLYTRRHCPALSCYSDHCRKIFHCFSSVFHFMKFDQIIVDQSFLNKFLNVFQNTGCMISFLIKMNRWDVVDATFIGSANDMSDYFIGTYPDLTLWIASACPSSFAPSACFSLLPLVKMKQKTKIFRANHIALLLYIHPFHPVISLSRKSVVKRRLHVYLW